MATAKFQVFKSSVNGQFYYRLRSSSVDSEIILSGEGYTTKQNCLGAIASVKGHAPYDRYYNRLFNGSKWHFNLEASNGEKIGHSEMYNSSAARDNGIEAVKRDAPNAPIEDLT